MFRGPPKSPLFPYTTLFLSLMGDQLYVDVWSPKPVNLRKGFAQKYERYWGDPTRSEEHTSELQSRQYLVCRLLLEKKKPLQYSSSPPCIRCYRVRSEPTSTP